MVIRRIREHVAAQNWFAVGIDLAIVVLGVIIATQVNDWNEARIDRERGRSYRDRLIADLALTEGDMRASGAYYGDVRDHALAALEALDRPSAGLGEPFLNDAYQATQLFPRFGRHATYDEILTSGHAGLVGSAALRDRLSNFYWRMDGLLSLMSFTPPYRDRMRSLMPYRIQQRIRARCDEILTNDGRGLVTSRLPRTCAIDLDPAVTAAAVREIWSAPALDRDLTRVVIDLDTKILNFGKLEKNAREVRAALRARHG